MASDRSQAEHRNVPLVLAPGTASDLDGSLDQRVLSPRLCANGTWRKGNSL